jgi:hypothetical protein
MFSPNLCDDQHDEQADEESGALKITPAERHGDGVAAGLAQRRRGDLDDPEDEGDFGDLAQRFLFQCVIHWRVRPCCRAYHRSKRGDLRRCGLVAY